MDNKQINLAILESLSKSNGEKQSAVKLLAQLCARDDQLLRELVKPYLGAILLHRVDLALKQATEAQNSKKAKTLVATAPKPERTVAPAAVPPEVLDTLVSVLGNAIPVGQPRSSNGNPLATIGIGPGDIPPPIAGARHQRSIQTLAMAFKYKGK
ncbi:MAG: hypothetical protein ORO03_02195 [Alphaproteobacteria bacterium]|nr:hypothetical protein [Alphaproteobacteria bacterium]